MKLDISTYWLRSSYISSACTWKTSPEKQHTQTYYSTDSSYKTHQTPSIWFTWYQCIRIYVHYLINTVCTPWTFRPKRYCRCPRLSVRPSVCAPVRPLTWPCPQDNSSPIRARITKFAPNMHHEILSAAFENGAHWPWPSMSFGPITQNSMEFSLSTR